MAPFIACEKHGGQLYPEGGKCPICVKKPETQNPQTKQPLTLAHNNRQPNQPNVSDGVTLPSGTQTF